MKDTETILIQVSYILKLPPGEFQREGGVRNKLSDKIDKDIPMQEDTVLQWHKTAATLLDAGYTNCGRCSGCGVWTSDRERPDFIQGLSIGAVVDGKLLCNQCLPAGHPLAF